MKRIGIFPGTFDPIHEGHVAFCRAAAERTGLDAVYVLPERSPRAKHDVSPFAERVELIRRAIRTLPNVDILVLDDHQLTVDETLPQLRQRFGSAQLTFLLGSDVACHSLPHWGGLSQLLKEVEFVIALRAGNSRAQITDAVRQIEERADQAFRHVVIESPRAEISSSRVRGELD